LLKRFYVVDVYEDASLGSAKSVTVRLFVQSDTATLSDAAIDETVRDVLSCLERQCQATLR
jgi:phenylalanyl-tRNA synthetase beta subunit